SVYLYGKSYRLPVRCVRGGQITRPRFVDNGNGTVTDRTTGLMWEQDEGGYMDWDSAASYCKGFSVAGYSDWRMPNIKELESLADDVRGYPEIDPNFFPNAYATEYWSSTYSAQHRYCGAWYKSFDNGMVYDENEYGHYVRCVRGGNLRYTWTTKRLTWNGFAYDPAVAVDGPNIYVVWKGVGGICFKRSNDGGVTWTTREKLTNTGYSFFPAIAVDGPNIYVVWQNFTPENTEIYFKRSDDGGVTWTTTTNLSNNSSSSGYPAIAVDGSNIYVVWQNFTPESTEIYFKKSNNGGVTWTTTKRLTNNVGDSAYPAIAVNNSNIYVVWHDLTSGNYEIYFKKSNNGGVTWTTNKRLTQDTGDSQFPAIAVNGSNVYIVWHSGVGIYFKKSDDEGVTWTADKELTNNAGYSVSPVIAVDGSNIYVVWQDFTPGNWEIYFKWSEDEGSTWTTRRLTKNEGSSVNPAIAVDGSNIYVVWMDNIPDPLHYEIYFKKGVLY
ncbi:MAG: hypothetical protein A2Y81_04805, partial [Nitrospirae bacterium RBG_13_43_8]